MSLAPFAFAMSSTDATFFAPDAPNVSSIVTATRARSFGPDLMNAGAVSGRVGAQGSVGTGAVGVAGSAKGTTLGAGAGMAASTSGTTSLTQRVDEGVAVDDGVGSEPAPAVMSAIGGSNVAAAVEPLAGAVVGPSDAMNAINAKQSAH
ncbi:MAG: hypothetical protein E6G39_00085 [Actinobacteria bacterium]|nr:MAG: hypothetical protein E6G39_00085 [Actinomycetota bacterium]